MSRYGPYFADDEESSEDKISNLVSVNTIGNDQKNPPRASTQYGSSENQDDSKTNVTSAFSSFHTNEDNASFVSTTHSDPTDHQSRKQASASKSKKQRSESAPKVGTESSEVSCDDLVIVLEESKFLKVLEDVVKELVEKLVTEKISNRSSAGSQYQTSANRSKQGGSTLDIKRSFEKKVKDLTDSRKTNFDPDLPKRVPHERSNLDDENLTQQSSQPRSSKTPSESTQGKSPQPKPKVNRDNASGVKANSASHRNNTSGAKVNSAPSRKGAAESNPTHDPKTSADQVCYFKSKSSTTRKNPRKERGSRYRDDACKIICRTYMRPHPEDLKARNMKIANSLFSATFSLFMRKIKKQDTLAEKIGIALCGPRQCFEECSSQEQFESPEAYSNAQNRGQWKTATKSGAVLPKLKSSRRSKKSSGLNSQQSSACVKHCVDATTNARSTPTVLPKL
ncbi:dentin sialophosphoprotein-like [Heterodontus francisci]|uniref:dentin sialophosphoprotein-like n=1 Tax=Heterodontus francisci TaxID=7792 RepID=UPI00355AE807